MMRVALVQIFLYSLCFAEVGPQGTRGVELGKERLGLEFPVIMDGNKITSDKLTVSQNISSNTIELSTQIQDKRCMQKVVMEEKVEYEEVVECKHSYDKKCYTSLSTVFKPYQEEKCTESYVKDCFIEYDKAAVNLTSKVCRKPLVRDCDAASSEDVCMTLYETECITRERVRQVHEDVPECKIVVEETCNEDLVGYSTSDTCTKVPRKVCSLKTQSLRKVHPDTACKKIAVEMCGPKGCGYSEGAEECREKVKTVIFDKPEEVCKLDPRVTCKFVTKLVPQLKEVESCIDVPKEICTKVRTNPRKVKYPVIKNWCKKARETEDTHLAGYGL